MRFYCRFKDKNGEWDEWVGHIHDTCFYVPIIILKVYILNCINIIITNACSHYYRL